MARVARQRLSPTPTPVVPFDPNPDTRLASERDYEQADDERSRQRERSRVYPRTPGPAPIEEDLPEESAQDFTSAVERSQRDPYRLRSLSQRLQPAPQGPVDSSVLGQTAIGLAQRGLRNATAGARAIEASPVGQATEAVGGFLMNPIGTTLEAIDPELQRRYEAGAKPISKTVAGLSSMGARAVTSPKDIPGIVTDLAQAAKQASDGDVLAGVRLALEAYDKYSIPVATGLFEIFSDPENIAASVGPLAVATDVGKLLRGARSIDDALKGEAGEALRAVRGQPALNPVSEAGQVRFGGDVPEPPTGGGSLSLDAAISRLGLGQNTGTLRLLDGSVVQPSPTDFMRAGPDILLSDGSMVSKGAISEVIGRDGSVIWRKEVHAPSAAAEAAGEVALTQEAQDLIAKADQGSVPAFVTSNFERILLDNGIAQADINSKAPGDLLDMLRSRQKTAPQVRQTREVDADFVRNNLALGGAESGPPGVSVYDDNILVYRGPDGKTVASMTLEDGPSGKVIENLAAEGTGLLRGRAVVSLLKAAEQRGVVGVSGTVSQDAQRLVDAYISGRLSDVVATTPGQGFATRWVVADKVDGRTLETFNDKAAALNRANGDPDVVVGKIEEPLPPQTSTASRPTPPGGGGAPPPPRPPEDLPGPDTPGHTTPSSDINVFGLRPISTGLTRRDQFTNAIKETLGVGTPAEPHATPAFRERARLQPIIDSQSSSVSAQTGEVVRQTFPGQDQYGRFPFLADETLPGGPTVQDLAARLPAYWDRLTPAQRQAMTWLQERIAPYRQLWDEVGAREMGNRPDVIEGGFYLPRGSADLEGVDAAFKVYAGPTRRGKAGFEKTATFDSMAQGIDAGYAYRPFEDSVRSYIKSAGTRIADQHIANYLKAATDDAGRKIGSTVADRIDPALHDAVQVLRAKIAGRQETLLRRTLWAKYAHLDAERQAKAVTEELERTLKAGEHAEFLRQTKWAGSTEKEIAQAEADLRALEGITKRHGRRTDARIGSMLGANERLQDTIDELNQFRSEYGALNGRWKQAQARAQQTPRGMGQIGMVELQGTAFPDELANAANKVLAGEGEVIGKNAYLPKTISAVNNLVRGFRATGDVSYMMIQGLLGLAKDQKAYSQALSVATRAWGVEGDRMLGKFIQDFDAASTAGGLPNSVIWTRNGTHVGGAETEYTIGAGLAGRAGEMIKNAPIIRQSNRAFGYFGDTLRLQWAQNELRTAMRQTGKTWQELEASGDMQRIAEAVNRGTGWANDKAAGDLGDLVFFAPRFFQSRLETLGKAAQGMRPGAPLDQAIARDSLIKLIGGGALLTYMANQARGIETDWRPWTYDNDGNATRNPNFARIRDVAGRDWSVFGTWDTLLGGMINVATGDPLRALRGMASPVLSDAWDLVTGKNYSGKPTTDTPAHFAEWLATSHIPFTATNLGDVKKSLEQGQFGQAAAVIPLTLAGAKGSPLSYGDVRENIAQSKYQKPWGELTGRERYEVEQATELQDRQKEFLPPDTGNKEQRVAAMFARREVQLDDLEANLRKALDRGLKGKERTNAIRDYKARKFQVNQDFLTPEVLAEMERTKSKTLSSLLADEYWNYDLEQPNGELDYVGRDRHRIAVLEKAKRLGVDPKDVTFKKPVKDPVVQKVLEQYDAAMEILHPYFAVRDVLDADPKYRRIVAEVNALPPGSWQRKAKESTFSYQMYLATLKQRKDRLRSNRTVDKALQEWEGYQPYNAGGGGTGTSSPSERGRPERPERPSRPERPTRPSR